jgi:glycosidase
MTNFDFNSINELDDVLSHGLNKLMKKYFIPGFLRWKWIKASSRDNSRTPVQWDGTENAGFTKGKPWLGINKNYKYINYASQKNDPDSVLSFYKKFIALRQQSECLKSGDFIPLYADTRIMMYKRVFGDESYTAVFNFSSQEIKIPKKAMPFLTGEPVTFTTGRTEVNGILLPWEGMLFSD